MRTTEILLRLSDVGARVALRRGAVEDRAARLRAPSPFSGRRL